MKYLTHIESNKANIEQIFSIVQDYMAIIVNRMIH